MIVKLTLNTDRFIMRSLVFVRNDQTNIWPCGHAIGLPWTRSPYTLENAKATYGWCRGGETEWQARLRGREGGLAALRFGVDIIFVHAMMLGVGVSATDLGVRLMLRRRDWCFGQNLCFSLCLVTLTLDGISLSLLEEKCFVGRVAVGGRRRRTNWVIVPA